MILLKSQNSASSMGTYGMGSDGGNKKTPADFDWDLAAEEELRAIEASYVSSTSKRVIDLTVADDASPAASVHRSPRRRLLPDSWTLAPHHPSPVNIKMRHPAINFGGHIVYCRTTPEVEQATSDLVRKINDLKQNADRISLGFDIEWRPVFRRGQAQSKAAVMQICVDTTHCYVMHIIHSGIPPTLKFLLEDSSSVKVGVAIANDATKISRDYGVCVEPLEDLSVVANLKLGTYKNWSLASLTETLACKELAKPKKIRMGNWEAYPLSREQLQYAATDAFVSWYLYEILQSFPDWKSENDNVEKANDVAS